MRSSSVAASDRASTYTFSWAAAVRFMHSWGNCSSAGRTVHLAIRRLPVCIPDSPGCILKYSPTPVIFFLLQLLGRMMRLCFPLKLHKCFVDNKNLLWLSISMQVKLFFFSSGWTCPVKDISGLWVAMQFPQRPAGQIRLDPTHLKSEFLE